MMSNLDKCCIVLDMDGTLTGSNKNTPAARPHMREFLTFCFSHFKHVSIWTAASEEWFDIVYNKIFKSVLIKLKKQFSFIYTREKCRNPVKLYKPLSNIWKRTTKPFKDYNPGNTIIIDDNSEACIFNKKSSIIIPCYKIGDRDIVLKQLVSEMTLMLKKYKKTRDIRETIPSNRIWR